jgi:hypothetical protein
MTVEEALLAVVGLIALVLLFLGLADALEGDPRVLRRRRRRLARRGPSRPPARLRPWRASPRRPAPPLDREPASPVAEPDPLPEAMTEEWRGRVAAMIRGRQLVEARESLGPALAADRVDEATAGFLLNVAATAVARDLKRLRRALRRGGADEAPLGGSLEITRLLLEAPVAQALPRDLRRQVTCRIWRGHTRLGLRRWRAGSFEGAVEALFQALTVPGIDERRRRLARDLLVRTLEDMAGQSLELIPQLLGEGDRAAALAQAQRLLTHIHRAREDGVSAEDLAVAASRARQLLVHIEQAPVS